MSNTKTKNTLFERLFFWVVLIGIILGVNYLIFSGMFSTNKIPKVDNVGDTVVLRYAPRWESYYIDGIEDAEFTRNGKVYTFYSTDYIVREDGAPYDIMNSKGEKVGSINLRRDDNELSVMKIDLSEINKDFIEIPATCDKVRVYASGEDRTYSLSIQIAERTNPVEVEFDKVSIQAPDVAPVLYSLSAAHVNVRVVGNVSLKGGTNPYTMEHAATMDKFIDTVETAASAYCVCMVSAVGTAASIVYGVDYYMDMFAGVTSLQLNVMENAWGKVEELFNGRDGYPGLDGVPALQVAGKLNVVGDSNASLKLEGGNGGTGGDGSGSFMTTTKGGRGGNGASAIVCGTLATNLGDRISYLSGEGGFGGEGGTSVTGTGSRGNRGGQHEPKVIIDSEILFD